MDMPESGFPDLDLKIYSDGRIGHDGVMIHRRTFATACFSLLLSLVAASAVADPIEDNPVFASLVGQWEGEGELVDPSDGSITTVKETWKGEFTGGGNFAISGRRHLGQDEHEFAWEFYANDDLIEGQMRILNSDLDLRFEAHVSDSARTVTIRVPLTGGGGVLTIVNLVSEDGTTIEGSVELVDDTGLTTSTGKVVHTKR